MKNWLKRNIKLINLSSEGKWSFRILIFLLIIALMADFIANDKPLFVIDDGRWKVPIVQNYLANVGLMDSPQHLDLSNSDYVVPPPVFFSPKSLNVTDKFKEPFTKVNSDGIGKYHWLGSDELGRDVASGIIHGTRISLSVGLLAILISLLIGITLGVSAGYFGDKKVLVTRNALVVWMFIAFLSIYLGYIQTLQQSLNGKFIVFVLILSTIFIGFLVTKRINRSAHQSRKIYLPIDMITMRIVEIFKSLPVMFILLTLVIFIERSSIIKMMLIIGLVSWPSFTQLIRAEVLKVNSSEFVEAAQLSGMKFWSIIWVHIIPNSIGPVIVAAAFGVSGAILLESALSFLGIGLGADEVTWGTMLSQGRKYFSAWWLVIFPGIAIFLSILSFNLLGDAIRKNLSRS